MKHRNSGKESFPRKNSGPKSERTNKDSAYGKKPSFPKSKKPDFKKRTTDSPKNSSFEKKSSFSKEKSTWTGSKKRCFEKRDSGSSSSFEKKSSFPEKDYTKGKTKPWEGKKKSDFIKKDREKDSAFEKKPSPGKKEEFSSRKHKSYSENKRDFKKKESEKPFGKEKKKDFPRTKDQSFSAKKPSTFRKKEPFQKTEKSSLTPQYNLERPKKAKKDTAPTSSEDLIRLNRYIANSGVCSRRDADTLIELGEISVNGKVIKELGFKVSRNDVVKYGQKVISPEKPVYILLNKPKDFITTTEDPQERRTVMALVQNACKERIYPVGRLDRNTTGLLLLTNDGELAKKLTHPSGNVKKLYQADLDKALTREDFDKILNGLQLEDGPVQVDALAFVSPDKKSIGIEIHEGRNRIVRRIFEHLGYDVVRLDRVMYAGLTKKDLPRGKWKFLSEKEVVQLKYFL